jgi:transporter family protein
MPRWLIWTLIALLSWAAWAVLSKLLGDALTGEQIQALSTLGLVPILLALAMSKKLVLRSASPRGLGLTFAGGVVSCLGNLAFYDALARGQKVATAVSLTALYPLTTILLAVLFLRERLQWLQCIGIGLSLAALWLFNIQGNDRGLFSRTVVFALPPILLWGLSGFLQKVATNHLSAESAAFVYLGAFVPAGILFALSAPWPTTLTPRVWLLVIAVGFFLGFGNLAILAAFARGGQAAVITPLSSLYPLLSIPAAVLFLGEELKSRELMGIVAALASVAAFSIELPRAKAAPGTPGAPTEPTAPS